MRIQATEATEGPDDDEDEGWDMEERKDAAELERHRREVEERYKRRSAPTLNPDILKEDQESMLSLLDRLTKYAMPSQSYADDAQSMVASEYGTSHHATHAQSIYPASSINVDGSTAQHHQPQRAVYHHGQSSMSVQATLCTRS